MKNSTSIIYSQAFTLIEVLITLFIVSFGMLGIAKLQLVALQEAQNGYFTSKASFFLSQMSDHIISNSTALADYNLTADQNISAALDCTQVICTPSQLAHFDLSIWQQQLKSYLPSGSAQIKISNEGAQIIVHWDANRNGSFGKNCPKLNTNDLDCSQVKIRLIK